MTQTDEISGLMFGRSKRSKAWKPVHCRSTASKFDQLESHLLEAIVDEVVISSDDPFIGNAVANAAAERAADGGGSGIGGVTAAI